MRSAVEKTTDKREGREESCRSDDPLTGTSVDRMPGEQVINSLTLDSDTSPDQSEAGYVRSRWCQCPNHFLGLANRSIAVWRPGMWATFLFDFPFVPTSAVGESRCRWRYAPETAPLATSVITKRGRGFVERLVQDELQMRNVGRHMLANSCSFFPPWGYKKEWFDVKNKFLYQWILRVLNIFQTSITRLIRTDYWPFSMKIIRGCKKY